MSWLRRGILLVLFSLVALGLIAWYQFNAPIPHDPGVVTAPGLSAPVTVRYDHRRRPFVQAERLQDAVFVQGWLHARARYWQMELLRRAGKGRLAELLGSSLLPTDVEITLAGVPALAGKLSANASDETLAVVDAYVAGINLAVQTLAAPLEFRLLGAKVTPWSREDVFAIGGIMAFQSGRNMRNELLRLSLMGGLDQELAALFGRRLPPGLPAEVDFDRYLAMDGALSQDRPFFQPPMLGSNGWVVSPGRSTNGRALFAFDSHDGWGMPSLFYEVHLFFGAAGDQSIRGFSVPGLPGVINGFNEFMAWGFTNIGDSQDLYQEIRDPENPKRFKGRRGWYEAEVVTVRIPVSGREAHVLEIVHTENGPLIQSDPPLSLRWSAREIGDRYGLDGLFLLNRATSFDAFMAAIDRFAAPSANVTYADVEGNIVFRTLGLLPRRGKGDGLVPLAADDPEGDWVGLMPLAWVDGEMNLPRSINPDVGYLIKANARVLPEPPLISADNAPGYRQARLEELLGASAPISFEDMVRWQGDWHNKQAEWLLPMLLPLVAEHRQTESFEALSAWQHAPVNEPDLLAPLLFNEWYLAIAAAVFEPVLGAEKFQALLGNSYLLNHALDRLILDDGSSPWWRGEKPLLVTNAFEAVHRSRIRTEAPSNWGEAHGLKFRHEMSGAVPGFDGIIDRGPYAWGGGNPTVGRARYRYDRPFTATGGATVRLVVEMSEPMRIGAVMPGGQSGHPASPHYDDQIPVWIARKLDPIAARPDAAGEVVTTLLPSSESD